MAVLTLTETELEVFGGSVLEAYQHNDYIQEDWLQFQGQTAGELVNVPIINPVVASQVTLDGVAHTAMTASIRGIDVPLYNPIKAYCDITKTQVDVRPDLNLLTNMGHALGRAVGYGRTVRLANLLMKAADLNANIVTADISPATGTIGEEIALRIEQIAGFMDDAGVDQGQRYAIMKPAPFYHLAGVARIRSSDFANVQVRNEALGGNMAVIEYLGFTIRCCGGIFGINWTSGHAEIDNAALQFNALQTWGHFWQYNYARVRHQTALEANVEWIHRDQVWMPIARLHFGAEVLAAGTAPQGQMAEGGWNLKASTV